MDPQTIFRAIESLELHLHEPRFACAARAQKIGKFIANNGGKPGRVWALPLPNRSNFSAPLLDANGKPFPHAFIDTPEGSETRAIMEDSQGTLAWNHHVAAADIEDWYCPVVYDPVMFSGPVTMGRWMSVFYKHDLPRFVKTDWGTAPVNSWMGSTYAPGHANEHDPFTDDHKASFELSELSRLSRLGVRYSRHGHKWSMAPR